LNHHIVRVPLAVTPYGDDLILYSHSRQILRVVLVAVRDSGPGIDPENLERDLRLILLKKIGRSGIFIKCPGLKLLNPDPDEVARYRKSLLRACVARAADGCALSWFAEDPYPECGIVAPGETGRGWCDATWPKFNLAPQEHLVHRSLVASLDASGATPKGVCAHVAPIICFFDEPFTRNGRCIA
jgi:hypothetical protein